MESQKTILIAVTGAQGVGKSTFCSALLTSLRTSHSQVQLISGLGEKLTAQGYSLGKSADEAAVAAVVLEHLSRERAAPPGIVILDRCLIDMLAYVRTLKVTKSPLLEVYEEIVRTLVPKLKLVVFLEMSNQFLTSSAIHEDADFRAAIDAEVKLIISELGVDNLSLDAADNAAVEKAVAAISEAASGA